MIPPLMLNSPIDVAMFCRVYPSLTSLLDRSAMSSLSPAPISSFRDSRSEGAGRSGMIAFADAMITSFVLS